MATIKFIDVYEATGPWDTLEGRSGGDISHGFFTSESAALLQAEGKGVSGTPGKVVKREAIVYDGRVFLIQEIKAHDSMVSLKREQALKKLTEEDKRILGLK